MTKNIILAALLSVIAAAAFTLSFLSPVTVDALIGYACVFGLLGIAVVDYRLSWKGLFSRS